MKQVLTLIIVTLISGCVASGPQFQKVQLEENGSSVVYFYRTFDKTFAGAKANFYVDDKKVIELLYKGYTYVQLSPGNYTVKQSWESVTSTTDGPEIEITVRENESLYIVVEPWHYWTEKGLVSQWVVKQVPEEEALKEIQKNRFQENIFEI